MAETLFVHSDYGVNLSTQQTEIKCWPGNISIRIADAIPPSLTIEPQAVRQ
jgi:hypothetical protein